MNNLITLITGASSGIGAEFARQLSSKGYDSILVARREDKLKRLDYELRETYKTNPETLTADLSTNEGVEKVQGYINNLDHLDILVNNAGFGIPKKFYEADLDRLKDMIKVHITAPTSLCHTAILKMPKGSAIINVSSLASLILKPESAIYCGTKSYLTVFSNALQKDLKDKEIKVQALCPGYTYTGFHDTEEFNDWERSKIPKFLWTSAEEVVEKSLKALDKKEVVHIPGFHNKVLLYLMNNKLIAPLIWKHQEKNQTKK